jgi:hypothetical protein
LKIAYIESLDKLFQFLIKCCHCVVLQFVIDNIEFVVDEFKLSKVVVMFHVHYWPMINLQILNPVYFVGMTSARVIKYNGGRG